VSKATLFALMIIAGLVVAGVGLWLISAPIALLWAGLWLVGIGYYGTKAMEGKDDE